jgi:acylphosphatase
MPQVRFSGRIEGRVQGVGFRAFTQKTAHQYQLGGWVKNESDGSVVFETQGEQKNVEAFLELIKKGPVFSKVSNHQFTEEKISDLASDFRILR